MKTNDIEEQFNKVAKEYDVNRKKFIPCFEVFYDGTTKFIASNIVDPKTIVDLGAGTGLLSSYWYRYFPKSNYILVDVAEDMLRVAKERFAQLPNVSYQVEDYSQSLPKEDCDVIVSALSIHHLPDMDKSKLFKRIYEKLPDKGIFVNYDQFCADSEMLNNWHDTYWENGLQNSGLTSKDIELWRERRKLDIECSVEQEVAMLRYCGFKDVKCLYSCGKFSVIFALKNTIKQ
ncbi:MAG: class I SAM-dependent methyltransferase [Clostridia bacterium]|nr:class I SAM-dependent methyltransferase [Clostridia bacterium]